MDSTNRFSRKNHSVFSNSVEEVPDVVDSRPPDCQLIANWISLSNAPKPSRRSAAEFPVARPPTRPNVYTLSGRPWTGRWSHSPPGDRSDTGWRRRCLRDRGGLPTSFHRGPCRPPDISCLVVSSTVQEIAAGRPSAAPPQVHYKLEYSTVSHRAVSIVRYYYY